MIVRGTRQRKRTLSRKPGPSSPSNGTPSLAAWSRLPTAVLRNELAVQHLVAEVVERDGLEQPEIVHHLQAGQLDVAQGVAGVCSVLSRAVRPRRTGTYVDPWTLYSGNAKAGLIGTCVAHRMLGD